jgi:hypothetical protein
MYGCSEVWSGERLCQTTLLTIVFGIYFMQDRISATAGALCLEEGESILFEKTL